MTLCFAEDEYTQQLQDDKGQALWQCRLSDGSVVTMDDGRPGLEIPSAWVRLGNYIRDTGLRIVKMWLKFRSNCDQNILPEDAAGYFFSKSIMAPLDGGAQSHFYIVGFLNEEGGLGQGRLYVEMYSTPTLILVHGEHRDPATVGEQLIRNPKCQEIGPKTQ